MSFFLYATPMLMKQYLLIYSLFHFLFTASIATASALPTENYGFNALPANENNTHTFSVWHMQLWKKNKQH